VVTPSTIDIEVPTNDGGVMRRGLMVIGKIVQSLANNMFFGKVAHMAVLNPYLKANIATVTRFLSEVNVSYLLWKVSMPASISYLSPAAEIFSCYF